MLYYATYHLIYTALLFYLFVFTKKISCVYFYFSTYELHLLASFSIQSLVSPSAVLLVMISVCLRRMCVT